jgi:hypothetical protein
MIHVLLTHDPVLRDAAIAHFSMTEKEDEPGVYQKQDKILLWSSDRPEELVEKAFNEYAAERVWILSEARSISTEHQVGDIVLPNTFLMYDRVIEQTDFNKDNRDSFLHDALFVSHYDEQSDLDFETFGLSIGGITVTKTEGLDDIVPEQVDFAYSADCVDPVSYPLLLAAKKLDRSEDVYPALAITEKGLSSEQSGAIYSHLFHVLEYLQAPVYENEAFSLNLDTEEFEDGPEAPNS